MPGTQQPGETFHTRQVQVVYQVGRVFVSGNPPPSSSFAVDDGIRVIVLRPDGTTASTTKQFPTICGDVIVPQPRLEVTSLFQPGLNTVTVERFDVCGVLERTLNAPLWLANTIP